MQDEISPGMEGLLPAVFLLAKALCIPGLI